VQPTTTENKPAGIVKHTPGPWRATPSDDGPSFVDIHADDWGAFARVVVRMEDDDANSPEGLANVNLFLAAPDLLKAVKVAKDFFINPGSFNPLDVERLYEAAIAKAERGQ
jgi:hypothetical protein